MPTRTRVLDESLVDAGHDTAEEEVHETRQDDYGHPDGISPGVVAQRNDTPLEPARRDTESERNAVRFRDSASGNADGAGALTVEIVGPREGHHWLLDRFALNGGSGTCRIFVGQTDDRGLVEFSPDVRNSIADENSPVYVPENTKLFFVFAGLPAAGAAVMNWQGRIVRGDF